MEYYPLRNPFKEQISPSTTSKQIPLQEDPSFYYEHFKNLHLQASNPRSNHAGSNSTRSVSASRNEGKTLRDQLKDLSDESSRQRTRSISPFTRGSNKQTASLRENMMNNREINYGKETENRQKGKGVMEKCGVQEKKKDPDCSYSWNEEEEDSRKYESIVTEDSMREDEIREKLMQMQEDILKKMKLKGRSVQSSRFMDGSFLNETLLNIGKPSVSPSSLTSFLASHENSQYMMNQTKRNSIAKENNSLRSLNTTMDKGKAKKSSLDFNDNYSRIVHIDSKITDSQDSSLRKSRNFGLALDIDPSVLLGCTKLQLFLQKSKFRSLNSSFRLIKEKPMMMILKDTSRMGDLSRREASMCETPFSFRTCVSAVTERYSNVQLGTVMVKNVMNKRLQCAFFALKSKLSFHQLQYKASIASGAIILSKLFRAHERSLSLQCLGVWKLRHALQMQRDEELAEKNQEIKKLSQEKNQALFTLAEEQDKWMLTHSPQATPKPLRESNKMEQISNKENSMQGQVPQGFGKQGLEKVEMKEKSVLIKKTPDILDETRKANQLLYEQLKALYDKKCFVEEAQPKASKPLSVVNSNTSYQKPFLLGQPNKNGGEGKQDGMVLRVSTGRLSNSRESCLESEDRCLSSKQMSKRSSVASHAYDSFDREAALNSRQSRRGSSRIWE